MCVLPTYSTEEVAVPLNDDFEEDERSALLSELTEETGVNKTVKSLRGIKKGTKNIAAFFNVVVYCCF